MSEEAKPNGQPKIVSLETAIPAHEEPAAILQIVVCKSGQIYIGRISGQERLSLPLCIDAVKTLYALEQQHYAEMMQDKNLIHVASNLNALGLGRRDN